MPSQALTPHSDAASVQRGAGLVAARFRVRRQMENASPAAARRRPRRPCGRASSQRALQPDVLGEHEPAVAADAPAVRKRPVSQRLAHRHPAENDAFDQCQPGIAGTARPRAAPEPGAVEQDLLLRQPVEPAPASSDEPDLDLCVGSVRAIDLLGRLRGQRGRGAGADARPRRSCGRRPPCRRPC